MNAPLVSIITPSFNKGKYIEETIQSVKDQSYSNIEHIVIDAGSTDETLDILRKYDVDLKWISEPDRGQSDAINKGWRMASGSIIAYLNADDTYLPDSVEAVVNYFETHPNVGMMYGDGFLSDESGNIRTYYQSSNYDFKSLVYTKNDILQPSVFLKRSAMECIGEVDISLHLAMDLDYWVRAGIRGIDIGYINKPLSVAKIYASAKSSSLMTGYVKEYEYILDKIKADPYTSMEVARWCEDAIPYVHVKGGLDYLHSGMIEESMRYLIVAISKNPIGSGICCGELLSKYIRSRIK